MPFIPGKINGIWIFEPRVFEDHRGFFYESFNYKQFAEATGFHRNFVQDNHSLSYYGVMRGLHFQIPPHAQAKLVRVIRGEILDVAVDIRKDSPTFGQHESLVISSDNKKQLLLPAGFAHGFVVLSEEAEVLYKCDQYYAPGYEGGIIYNDPDLNIDWKVPVDKLIISGKDQALKALSMSENPF